MARKKNRPDPVLPSGPVPVHPDSSTAISASPAPAPAPLQAALTMNRAGGTQESFWQTGLGYFLARLFKVFSGLPLAIVLLTCFTLTLVLGTILESDYSAEIAGNLLYHTWWFAVLLFFLGVNIVCAALSRIDPAKARVYQWPWKRHQTGFLVTHLGLITLVFGGLVTTLYGVEGQMVMIDTPDKKIQDDLGLENETSTIHLFNEHQLEVFQLSKKSEELADILRRGGEVPEGKKDQIKAQWLKRFNPGSFGWKDDAEKGYAVELPTKLKILNALANPFPGVNETLDSSTSLRLTNYYPHTEHWPYAVATKEDEDADKPFAVVMLRLSSPMFGQQTHNRWATTQASRITQQQTPIDVKLYSVTDPVVVSEFLSPPKVGEMGKLGQLVLFVDGKAHRIQLDQARTSEPVKLAGTDIKVTILETGNLLFHLAQMREAEAALEEKRAPKPLDPADFPPFPMVRYRVDQGNRSGEYYLSPRFSEMKPLRKSGDGVDLSAWYHYPDIRYGESPEAIRGVIEILATPDHTLYCRVFGMDGLRGEGFKIDPKDKDALYEVPFKGPMQMHFQLGTYMPKGVIKKNFMPRNLRPGIDPSETTAYRPAIRGQLQVGNQTRDFWTRMGLAPAEIPVGNDLFIIRYRPASIEADFAVVLKRASATKYAGTDRHASYRSDILVKNKGQSNADAIDTAVYMNHTVDHNGYRLFQANFEEMTDDRGWPVKDGERPVNKSGLQVGRDPGRWFKYSGTAIVVLGICIMFWMRAYFFKPRGN